MDIKEFPLEAVGRKHEMPKNVAEIRDALWQIFSAEADKPEKLSLPFGEFTFRPRNASDPVFRYRDFEGSRRREGEGIGPGKGGLDLLGRYQLDTSLVTIYVDSCRKVARRYDVLLEQLVRVVLVHELVHLVTHRGFEAKQSLPSHFWEYTAQCATYVYLQGHDEEALEVFKTLSPYQPFIYRTWESLIVLHAALKDSDAVSVEFEAFVENIFSALDCTAAVTRGTRSKTDSALVRMYRTSPNKHDR
jgi:hypothetical protein